MAGMRFDARLAVIVVAYNSAAVIHETLASVRRNLPQAAIVLVDNGSTDNSIEVALQIAPDATVVRGHGNVGFGAGVNRGARATTREFLLILNPDAPVVAVAPSSLEQLNRYQPMGLAVCAVLEDHDPSGHAFAQRPWGFEILMFLVRAFLMPREWSLRRRAISCDDPRAWVSGVALVARRTEFNIVGGFDTRFFLYCEDRDLSKAYRAAGLPLRSTAAIAVEHRRDEYQPSAPIQHTTWGLISLIEFIYKWDGSRAGDSSAQLAVTGLKVIHKIGGLVSRVPIVGRRAQRAARRAEGVSGELRRLAADSNRDEEHYQSARQGLWQAINGNV
jgi:GT2 family glycosyltransferase